MNAPIIVEFKKSRKRKNRSRAMQYCRPSLIRLRHLLWVPVIGGIVWAAYHYGTPHLRFQYQYQNYGGERYFLRCDYVGLHAQTIIPDDGQCPLVLFLKSPKAP